MSSQSSGLDNHQPEANRSRSETYFIVWQDTSTAQLSVSAASQSIRSRNIFAANGRSLTNPSRNQRQRKKEELIIQLEFVDIQTSVHKLWESCKKDITYWQMKRQSPLNNEKIAVVLRMLRMEGAIAPKNYFMMRYFGLDTYKSTLRTFNPKKFFPKWDGLPKRNPESRQNSLF
ncbi:hypothetical protein IH970_12480 [candidate division KSB1 bacterium]|nr:hypothetical protein [candidate division KSB1 bacterium]